MQHVFDLPFPPSTNRLWRSGRGRVHPSAAYTAWVKQADQFLFVQKRGPIKMLPGKFSMLLELWNGDGKRRRDADNCIKPCLDYAQRIGAIMDDAYCERGEFRWVPKEQAPATGCRLTLTSLE